MRRPAVATALLVALSVAGCTSSSRPPESAAQWLHAHAYLAAGQRDTGSGAVNVWDVATSVLGREPNFRTRHHVTGDPTAFRTDLLARTCDYVFGPVGTIRSRLHVSGYSLQPLTSGPVPAPGPAGRPGTGYAFLCSYSTDPRGSQLLDLEISPGEFELRNLTTYAQVRRGPVNGSVAFTAPPPGLVDIGAAEAYLRSRLARATYLPGPGH